MGKGINLVRSLKVCHAGKEKRGFSGVIGGCLEKEGGEHTLGKSPLLGTGKGKGRRKEVRLREGSHLSIRHV